MDINNINFETIPISQLYDIFLNINFNDYQNLSVKNFRIIRKRVEDNKIEITKLIRKSKLEKINDGKSVL